MRFGGKSGAIKQVFNQETPRPSYPAAAPRQQQPNSSWKTCSTSVRFKSTFAPPPLIATTMKRNSTVMDKPTRVTPSRFTVTRQRVAFSTNMSQPSSQPPCLIEVPGVIATTPMTSSMDSTKCIRFDNALLRHKPNSMLQPGFDTQRIGSRLTVKVQQTNPSLFKDLSVANIAHDAMQAVFNPSDEGDYNDDLATQPNRYTYDQELPLPPPPHPLFGTNSSWERAHVCQTVIHARDLVYTRVKVSGLYDKCDVNDSHWHNYMLRTTQLAPTISFTSFEVMMASFNSTSNARRSSNSKIQLARIRPDELIVAPPSIAPNRLADTKLSSGATAIGDPICHLVIISADERVGRAGASFSVPRSHMIHSEVYRLDRSGKPARYDNVYGITACDGVMVARSEPSIAERAVDIVFSNQCSFQNHPHRQDHNDQALEDMDPPDQRAMHVLKRAYCEAHEAGGNVQQYNTPSQGHDHHANSDTMSDDSDEIVPQQQHQDSFEMLPTLSACVDAAIEPESFSTSTTTVEQPKKKRKPSSKFFPKQQLGYVDKMEVSAIHGAAALDDLSTVQATRQDGHHIESHMYNSVEGFSYCSRAVFKPPTYIKGHLLGLVNYRINGPTTLYRDVCAVRPLDRKASPSALQAMHNIHGHHAPGSIPLTLGKQGTLLYFQHLRTLVMRSPFEPLFNQLDDVNTFAASVVSAEEFTDTMLNTCPPDISGKRHIATLEDTVCDILKQTFVEMIETYNTFYESRKYLRYKNLVKMEGYLSPLRVDLIDCDSRDMFLSTVIIAGLIPTGIVFHTKLIQRAMNDANAETANLQSKLFIDPTILFRVFLQCDVMQPPPPPPPSRQAQYNAHPTTSYGYDDHQQQQEGGLHHHHHARAATSFPTPSSSLNSSSFVYDLFDPIPTSSSDPASMSSTTTTESTEPPIVVLDNPAVYNLHDHTRLGDAPTRLLPTPHDLDTFASAELKDSICIVTAREVTCNTTLHELAQQRSFACFHSEQIFNPYHTRPYFIFNQDILNPMPWTLPVSEQSCPSYVVVVGDVRADAQYTPYNANMYSTPTQPSNVATMSEFPDHPSYTQPSKPKEDSETVRFNQNIRNQKYPLCERQAGMKSVLYCQI